MRRNIEISKEIAVNGALAVSNVIEETLFQLEKAIDSINVKVKKYEAKLEKNETTRKLSDEQVALLKIRLGEEKRKIINYQETLSVLIQTQNHLDLLEVKRRKKELKKRKYRKLLKALDST